MYSIFAGLGVVGIVASSFVPESYGEDFPDTIQDLKMRGKNPYFSWKVWEKKTKATTTSAEYEL